MTENLIRNKKRIAVDLATIHPGKGGAGGGIWTYACSLLHAIDSNDLKDLELVCFIDKDLDFNFKSIKTIRVGFKISNLFKRFYWVHILLPILCIKYKVSALHKVASEVPLFSMTKLLVTIHDFVNELYSSKREYTKNRSFFHRIIRKYFIIITRIALKKTNIIVVPSRTVADEAVLRYNVTPRKIKVIYEGPSPEGPPYISERRGCVLPFTILCVASFYPHKGHIEAIRTFHHLLDSFLFDKQEIPELIFRGHICERENEYYNKVVSMSGESKYKDRISFKKYDPSLKLNSIYGDAYITLSLSEYEGFGLPLIESQYFGVPVVCSDIPIFREMLCDSAVFIDRKSPREASAQLYNLMTDKRLYAEYVEKGRQNVKRFSWDKAAKEMLEVYNSLL